MPNRTRIDLMFRLASLGCILFLGAVSCAPAAPIDVGGSWSGTITWTSGPRASLNSAFAMDIFDDQGDLTGRAEFSSGYMNTFEIPITSGAVHADTIVFEASGQNPFTTPPTPVRFAFDGSVNGTTMSGVGTQFVNDTSCTFAWRATLVAPPAPES